MPNMNIQEYVVGFDIRCKQPSPEILARIAASYPEVSAPRSVDIYAWPSRFKSPYLPDQGVLSIQAKPGEAELPPEKLFTVSPDHSIRYDYTSLLENLETMLAHYPPDPEKDSVCAFTVFHFDSPVIYGYDPVNFSGKRNIFESFEWQMSAEWYQEQVTPSSLSNEQWIFRGYDVSVGYAMLDFPQNFFEEIGRAHV